MIRSIFFICILTLTSTFAIDGLGLVKNSELLNQLNGKSNGSVGIKDIQMNSRQFGQMIASLKEAYRMGDTAKAYIIGLTYMQKHVLMDRVIKPNKKEAIKWFKLGLKNGYGLNALQLALLEYFPKGDIFGTLDTIENGINAKYIDSDGKATLALAYGGIVLERLRDESKYVRKAIDILYPVAMSRNISTLDYTLANLLNLDKQTNLANKFLNSACNNPNVPRAIWNMCISGSEIKVTNNTTGQLVVKQKNGCPAKKLMPGL